jgi:peptidoglycan/LPS O-acetylase OafA/YrhL
MVHASQGLFGRDGAARAFLTRRLARIVPLYWAITSLFLLIGLVAPAVLNSGAPDLGQILASYLFWPVVSTLGLVQPVYSLGWTLNYEMLFYALFAAGLMLPARLTLPAVTLALAGLVAAESLAGPLTLPFGFWGQPIVLEFAAGMGIAVLRRKGLRLHGASRIAVAAAGAALLVVSAHFPVTEGSWDSVLWRGGAAILLMLAAACGREGIVPARPVKALAVLGDASYALYLVHPFVIRGMREAALRLGLHAPVPYIVLALAASVIAALLVYRFFEKPATRLVRRWLSSASSA